METIILPVLDTRFVVFPQGQVPIECVLVEVNNQVEITELEDGNGVSITIGPETYQKVFASERLEVPYISSLLIRTAVVDPQASIIGCSTIEQDDPYMERPMVGNRGRTVLFI